MYIDHGYIVSDTSSEITVLLEVKSNQLAIGSNFYEIKIDKKYPYNAGEEKCQCRFITNPIEYMQEASKISPLSLQSLISYEKLEDYYNYLTQVGLMNHQNESDYQEESYRGFYSLKSSRYNTLDESIYERKVK